MICNVRCSCFLLQSSTGRLQPVWAYWKNGLAKVRSYRRNRHIQKTERIIIFAVSTVL